MSDRPLLIAPVPMVALAVMMVNDHVLKWHATGWLTGKLSDIAGLICVPLVLLAVLEVVLARPLRSAAHVHVAAVVTGACFAAVKLSPAATTVYATTWGAMQWPAYAAAAIVTGDPWPALMEVACVTDPTDLVALVVLPWWGFIRGGRTWMRRIWGLRSSLPEHERPTIIEAQ